MDKLTSTFPDILFENCSGGGGRFDPAMLYYSPQIWASDNTDPIERLSIQFGTSLCYPASCVGAHVSACSRTGYRTKGNVALWGTFGYELDPCKLSEEDKEIVKEQVALYHETYDLIRSGDLYRLISPFENSSRAAWEFVSPEKDFAMLTLVTVQATYAPYFLLKLKGLDPDRIYRNEATGETASGALLMKAGLNLSNIANHDGDSATFLFRAV